jgi:hypothetical protein
MKITEKVIKANMILANRNSKHMGIGLQGAHTSKGYAVKIVQRGNGYVEKTFDNLTASEANGMIELFSNVALLTQANIEGGQI